MLLLVKIASLFLNARDQMKSYKDETCLFSGYSRPEVTLPSDDGGHNGDKATTLPMMIRVGDTNSASLTSSERLFSMANTCIAVISS